MRVCEWTPRFRSCAGCFQGSPSLYHPTQNTESWTAQLRGGQRLETEQGLEQSVSRGCRFYQEAHPWVVGELHLQILPPGPQAPPMLHVSTTHTHTLPWSVPCVLLHSGESVSLCRELVSTAESQPDSARLGGSAQTWELKTSLLKTNIRLSALSLALHAYNVKNSPSRGNKKCGTGVSMEKFWEGIWIPNRDNRRYFSPEANQ